MMVAQMARLSQKLKRLSVRIEEHLKRWCNHPEIQFVADAWDQEYICTSCDKRWFNEIPKLQREFTHNGSIWRLDGKGNVHNRR